MTVGFPLRTWITNLKNKNRRSAPFKNIKSVSFQLLFLNIYFRCFYEVQLVEHHTSKKKLQFLLVTTDLRFDDYGSKTFCWSSKTFYIAVCVTVGMMVKKNLLHLFLVVPWCQVFSRVSMIRSRVPNALNSFAVQLQTKSR